jgi:glucan endo-1,3-beta-D-glucosidase
MYFTQSLAATLFATLITAQRAYLGFNSGATLDTTKAKVQSDYEAEFKSAQGLLNSPGLFNSVRLYTNIQSGTTDTPTSAFQAAINTKTTMLLGIWCSGTTTIEKELSALNKAVTRYGSNFTDLVVGISVGSEDLYRVSETGIRNKAGLGQGPEVVIGFLKNVRDAISKTALASVPVGHVDTWSAWTNDSNADVIAAVDFLGTDLYSYYEDDKGNAIDNATTLFTNAYNATVKVAGGKPVWITETGTFPFPPPFPPFPRSSISRTSTNADVGWPTTGPLFGQASPSVPNAKTYWDQIGCTLFGKVPTYWYTLRDSNPDNKAKFAITKDLSTTPLFDLTCPSGSGAPASINTGT